MSMTWLFERSSGLHKDGLEKGSYLFFLSWQEGGQFEAYLLGPKGTKRHKFVLRLGKAQKVSFWSSLSEASSKVESNAGVYLMPVSLNKPVIDAIWSPTLYVQVNIPL